MKLKQRMYDIIFEAETPAGKAFDIFLLVAIISFCRDSRSESNKNYPEGRSPGDLV